jgi:pentatricopeptide repeat protein
MPEQSSKRQRCRTEEMELYFKAMSEEGVEFDVFDIGNP